jgi:hypothetical protein
MVRVLTAVARGSGDSPWLRSTRSDLTPYLARVTAATRPAGPVPAITTGTQLVGSAGVALSSCGLAEALDGEDPGRVDVRAGVGQRLGDGQILEQARSAAVVSVGAVSPGNPWRSRKAGARVGALAIMWLRSVSPPLELVVVDTMRERAGVGLWFAGLRGRRTP